MLRKIYTTATIMLLWFLAFRLMADPRAVGLWDYVWNPQHSPIEYLVIGTFLLVLPDRLEKLIDAWTGN